MTILPNPIISWEGGHGEVRVADRCSRPPDLIAEQRSAKTDVQVDVQRLLEANTCPQPKSP